MAVLVGRWEGETQDAVGFAVGCTSIVLKRVTKRGYVLEPASDARVFFVNFC